MKTLLQKIGFLEKDSIAVVEGGNKREAAEMPSSPFPQRAVPVPDLSLNDTSKYKKLMEDTLKNNNLEGPDFYEFAKTLESMATQPIPEPQKYLFAFTSFQTMGITKEKLLDSASHYISALQQEKNNFDGHIAQVNKVEVLDKQQKIQEISKENEELQQKIQQNVATINQLNQEAMEATARLQVARNGFDYELANVTSGINNMINNINAYIP